MASEESRQHPSKRPRIASNEDDVEKAQDRESEPMAPQSKIPSDAEVEAADAAVGAMGAAELKSALRALVRHDNPVVSTAAMLAIRSAEATLVCDEDIAEKAVDDAEEMMTVQEQSGITEPDSEVCADRLQPDREALVPEDVQAAPSPPFDTMEAAPSAAVLSSSLWLGAEAEEISGGSYDATDELASLISESGACQAFRIGRVAVPVGQRASEVPVSVTVVVANDGRVAWPSTLEVRAIGGDDLGFSHLPLGTISDGQAAEIEMDLLVPPRESQEAMRSTWAIFDTASGRLLGPLLIFETVGLPP